MNEHQDTHQTNQHNSDSTSSERGSKNMIAAATYLLFFLPFVTGSMGDEYVKYHFKQSLGFLIFAGFLRGFMAFLLGPPQFLYDLGGGILSNLLLQPIHIVLLILLGLGAFNAYSGNKKPLPLIGEYAERAFSNL
jgi:uncharacterized membrane protein